MDKTQFYRRTYPKRAFPRNRKVLEQNTTEDRERFGGKRREDEFGEKSKPKGTEEEETNIVQLKVKRRPKESLGSSPVG